ncbi:MAG: hypothetical protein WC959_10020 [Kiritimatiellales bacterium]
MQTKRLKLCVPVLCIITAACELTAGDIVVADGMDYSNSRQLNSVWKTMYGLSSVKNAITFEAQSLAGTRPAPASGTVLVLGNAISHRELGATLKEDWVLSAKILHKSYGRGQGIYLLNEAGTQGYGILWNSANVSQFAGNGFLSIRRFDNANYKDWPSFGVGTQLGREANSQHPVTGYCVTKLSSADQNTATYETAAWNDFLTVELHWSATEGTLRLYANGKFITQAADNSFSEFSRIYLRGNSDGYFDDIQVSTGSEKK